MVDVHPEESLEEGFYVGEYFVEPQLQRITGTHREVRVEPKVMEVLVLLARQPGRAVTKTTFMQEVWTDTIVSGDALLRCISELRKLFGDDPQEPRYIETIRKRGYRLIAPVMLDGAGSAEHATVDVVGSGDVRSGVARSRVVPRSVWIGVASLGLLLLLLLWGRRPPGTSAPAPLNAIPLTSLVGVESDPNLSPDGSRTAFVWDGGEEGRSDIYVKQIGVDTPLRLTNGEAEYRSPAWSPDGQEMAYIRSTSEGSGVFVAPAIGGNARQVATFGERASHAVAWSPDGRTLAVTIEQNPHGAFGVWLLTLETAHLRQLTQPPADFRGDHDVAFSPDGRFLAFVRGVVERVDDIYLVPFDGGEARRLTFDHAEITGLDWTPDGRDVIFSSDREGAFALWRVATRGGNPQWIPTGGSGSGVHQPSVSREGVLAYIQRHQEINIWKHELGTTDPSAPQRRPVVSSTRWDSNPAISPRGDRIAFASNRAGGYEIWTADANGREPMQLTRLGGPFANTPRWSPDGASIAFAARDEGSVDIYVVDVTGGTPRRLTPAASNDQAPAWSADGLWIYFGSNRSGMWQVWKIPADGGDAVQVTTDGGYAASESSDGATLYYVKRDVPGLWRMPTGGGRETLLIADLQPYDWGNWAVTPDGICFVQRGAASPRIAWYDFGSERTEQIAVMDRIPRHPSMSLAPDAEYVLLATMDRSDADILYVRDFK